jgi:hypothetical protein
MRKPFIMTPARMAALRTNQKLAVKAIKAKANAKRRANGGSAGPHRLLEAQAEAKPTSVTVTLDPMEFKEYMMLKDFFELLRALRGGNR